MSQGKLLLESLKKNVPNIAMHIYNTSTQKAEAGDSKFKTNLGYKERREEQKREHK